MVAEEGLECSLAIPHRMRKLLLLLVGLPCTAVLLLITCYQRTLSPDHPPSPRLRWARYAAIQVIKLYQHTLSPDHGPLRHIYTYGFCRHEPTCSEYGKRMIEQRGVLIGSLFLFKRLLSCHPWRKPSEEKIAKTIERASQD